MSNRLDFARKELNTLNDLQRYMSHEDKTGQDVNADAFVNIDNFNLISRFNSYRDKMALRQVEKEFEFAVPKGVHQLNMSTFFQKLPAVSLKEEYRDTHLISWTPKTLLRMIESAQLYIGEDKVGTPLTGRGIDIWLEYHSQEFFKVDYETLLEMVQGSEGWKTNLREQTLSLFQPFTYSTARSFLKCCLIENKIFTHRYKLRRNIRDLLMMKKRVGDQWEMCPPGDIKECCVFSEISTEGELSNAPELWGSYIITNEIEYNDIKEISMTQNYLSHVQELVYLPHSNVLEGNGTAIVPILLNGCVRGIYWNIQNISPSLEDNYFDFSTTENLSPIISTTLKTPNEEIWTIESYHHRKITPGEVGLRTPRLQGYHYHPFSANGSLKSSDTSVDLSKLNVSLNVDFDLGSNKGKLHVFLDMHRVISYSDGNIRILRDEAPVMKQVVPSQQMIQNRPAVAQPIRHR